MITLTPEDTRQLGSMFKALIEARLEVGILRSMLITYAKNGKVPPDWEQAFEAMKDSDLASSFWAPYKPLLQKIEESALLDDLKELVSKMPPEGLIN